MQNRTPVPRAERPALPDFTPVPRRNNRHDGWTPERQRAFIEALADTGCVSRAAAMVNMAQANCYTLRRAPGAEGFRRAWDAALDFGLARLKDIAFERAIEGELIPVFSGGKLIGFQRKRNNALLIFCLRHYGQDAGGKRTTINYFSTRASAGSAGACDGADGGAAAGAQASTTTLRTVITGDGSGADAGARGDEVAAALNGFEGVALDAEAQAAIETALRACAERQRAHDAALEQGGEDAADAAEDDPDTPFVRVGEHGSAYRGELLPPVDFEDYDPIVPGEPHWSQIGAEPPPLAIAEVKKRRKPRKRADLE
ncbi:MAG: hypothetical protein V4459_11030 [Pseudomonadota bacterium]